MGAIHVTHERHISVVTIDDAERYNAMSLSMWIDLKQAFDKIEADSDVRVVVLRGAGEKAFVSGANISEFETQRTSEASVAHYNQSVALAQEAITRCRVPVIAAISGICYGGGLGLALSCDLRYASPASKFRMPAARLGLGYGYRGMKSIVHNLGPTAAAEAFYTAKVYGASEAAQIGIVNAVHDNVFEYCAEVALQISQNAPLTVQAAKQAMLCIADGDTSQISRIDQAVDTCFKSSDYAEGRKAFAEKRLPQFTGH
jgi:enoyl-CoA hydratase/carnithine racemase